MERREVINGELGEITSAVREAARRSGKHFERVVYDQTTFERVRIFSEAPEMGGVVLLEDPTDNEPTKIIGPEEFVDEVTADLSREHVSLEPRALLSNTS